MDEEFDTAAIAEEIRTQELTGKILFRFEMSPGSFGNPADMPEAQAEAREHGLYLHAVAAERAESGKLDYFIALFTNPTLEITDILYALERFTPQRYRFAGVFSNETGA